jgi:glycosyltransferase involved in cell wall biosynthesis
MKILYIVHSFPPYHWRGTEVYTMELSQAMKEHADPSVYYICHEEDAENVKLVEDSFEDTPVHRVHMKIDPTNPAGYFFNQDQEEVLKTVLQNTKPDVVHFIYFTGGLSVGLPKIAKEFGAKTVITVTDFSGFCPRGQGLDKENQKCSGPDGGIRCVPCLFEKGIIFKSRKLDRFFMKIIPIFLIPKKKKAEYLLFSKRLNTVKEAFSFADLVIYPNSNTKEIYNSNKFKSENEMIIDYGINTSHFQNHIKTESGNSRVAFIGQILPHKGLDLLVEALKEVPLKFKLLIYGSKDDPGAEEFYDSLELDDFDVEFRGVFPFQDMNKVLTDTDILVVPSKWDENCPLTVKYSIITGTFTILADQPGMIAKREDLTDVEFFDIILPGNLRRSLIRALASVFESKKDPKNLDKSDTMEKVLSGGAIIDIKEQAKEFARIYKEL